MARSAASGPNPTINRVAERAGSVYALAKVFGVSHQVCLRWVHQGWMPPKRAKFAGQMYDLPWVEMVNPDLRDLIAEDPDFV